MSPVLSHKSPDGNSSGVYRSSKNSPKQVRQRTLSLRHRKRGPGDMRKLCDDRNRIQLTLWGQVGLRLVPQKVWCFIRQESCLHRQLLVPSRNTLSDLRRSERKWLLPRVYVVLSHNPKPAWLTDPSESSGIGLVAGPSSEAVSGLPHSTSENQMPCQWPSRSLF